MDPSTFNSWDGVGAVFTFGPESVGMYLFLLIALAIGVGVLARMIRDENRTFAAESPDLTERGALQGANI